MTKKEINKILRQLEIARSKNNANWMQLFKLLKEANPTLMYSLFGIADEYGMYLTWQQREKQNRKISKMLRCLLARRGEPTKKIITAICKQDRKITATARRLAK